MEDKEEDWFDDEELDLEDYDPSKYTLDVSDTLTELETD